MTPEEFYTKSDTKVRTHHECCPISTGIPQHSWPICICCCDVIESVIELEQAKNGHMNTQHDELCGGNLKQGMCDCDFINRVRENQLLRDMNTIQALPTKGGRGKWLLKSKITSALWSSHYKI